MRAIVLGIALVLGILGFLIFMGGYDIYSNPLRGTSFWESFFAPSTAEYLYRKAQIAWRTGMTMMFFGILMMGGAGLILIVEYQKKPSKWDEYVRERERR